LSPLLSSLRFLQRQPDARLMAFARGGHKGAFEVLVQRYRRPLLAYCRRVAPEASAEDILQQALLQAWSALGAGLEVRDPRAWLYRIVHNVAISSVRRASGAAAEPARGVSALGADDELEQRLAARHALAELAALPGLQRDVMLGTALDGRSHDEIAGALGLSPDAVRGLVYRARARLRSTAAAVVPAPLVEWLTRETTLVGTLAKSGAVVGTVGALAAVSPIPGLVSHSARHLHSAHAAVRVAPLAPLVPHRHTPAASSHHHVSHISHRIRVASPQRAHRHTAPRRAHVHAHARRARAHSHAGAHRGHRAHGRARGRAHDDARDTAPGRARGHAPVFAHNHARGHGPARAHGHAYGHARNEPDHAQGTAPGHAGNDMPAHGLHLGWANGHQPHGHGGRSDF
jgi:RNA polymerase sigma factor (sigma-70 family)